MNFIKHFYPLFMCVIALVMVQPDLCSQVEVKQISNADGLSNNSINCILEDSEHIVWVGTWDGLNAYNGRDFKTYRYSKKNERSLSNNVIRQVVEQDSLSLWVATDYGVNRWNRKTQEFTRYFLGTEQKTPKQEKSFTLGITRQNVVICHVKDEGLFYFDDKQQLFISIVYDAALDIKTFVIDDNDKMYFLNVNGFLEQWQISYNNGVVSLTKPQYIEQNNVISDIFLSDDVLVVNYPNYLKVIDDRSSYPSSIDIEKDKTISQVICSDDNLFISYNEGGCVSYNLVSKTYSSIHSAIDKVSIFTLHKGSQDILWVGTDGQGLMKLYTYNSPFRTVRTNHPVRSFCENNDGDILIGTKGDGIKLLNSNSKQTSNFLTTNNGLISNSVYTIKKNKSGDIFIGTEGAGINILHAGNGKLEKLNIPSKYPFFKAVYSIHFSNNDSLLWLGTSGYGLIRISLQKKNGTYAVEDIKQYTSSNTGNALNNNIIYSIVSGLKEDELWLGTRGGGVNRFNIKNESFDRIEDINGDLSLTNNDILALLMDRTNSLWICTSYGLNKLFLTNSPLQLSNYSDGDGLANNTIHGILEDEDQNIWISSNLGITSINKKSILNYTAKDGLQNDEFSDGAYLKDRNNTLYFGGVSGFSYFNPREIQFRNHKPTPTLSGLKIFNTTQNIHERIENNSLKLSYDEPYVTFTFIAQDYINNENCEYAYRLLNFSDEWIKNGNNPNIVFTKLPPGKYQLEVKSTNGDRIWNENIYTLHIDVAYPWWLSTRAFIIYFLLAAIIAYIAMSVIRNRIRLNKQLLLEHIEKQNQKKIHESKLNFFTNVAHEFFTPLTLIYGPAQHLLEKVDLDSYTKRYIQVIKSNADRMQKLINELMEFRKVESGHTPLYAEKIDISLFVDYISDNYIEIAEENKIKFEVETKDISTFVTDNNTLEKIIFNLISNAFKYTPANGNIHVNLWQDVEKNNTLHFNIRNSGRGLTEKQMTEIFSRFKIFEVTKAQNTTSTGLGLNLTKSLTELLGGEIKVSSILGEYVEFDVVIEQMQLPKKETVVENEEIRIQLKHNDTIVNQKNISILIVEDEKNIRELLKDILSPYYNISEAANGEEGLEAVNMNLPDIIISDILMPKLDGIGLIDGLKSNPKTAHIPIISISAKNSVEDHINAYQHGADLYITKPFHPRQVLITVENLISKHSTLKKYFNSSRSAITVRDGITMHQEDEMILQEIVKYVEGNIDDETLSPNSISDFLGVSKATLYRKLKELTDKTPSEFVRAIRLEYASQLLITTKLTVAEIMFKSGFTNKSYFYREFAKQFALSPKEYRISKVGDF